MSVSVSNNNHNNNKTKKNVGKKRDVTKKEPFETKPTLPHFQRVSHATAQSTHAFLAAATPRAERQRQGHGVHRLHGNAIHVHDELGLVVARTVLVVAEEKTGLLQHKPVLPSRSPALACVGNSPFYGVVDCWVCVGGWVGGVGWVGVSGCGCGCGWVWV